MKGREGGGRGDPTTPPTISQTDDEEGCDKECMRQRLRVPSSTDSRRCPPAASKTTADDDDNYKHSETYEKENKTRPDQANGDNDEHYNQHTTTPAPLTMMRNAM